MPDVLISSDVADVEAREIPTIVMVDGDIFFFFYMEDSTNDVRYRKSSDGGATWAASVLINAGADNQTALLSIWYERWTPGDTTGTKVHVIVDNRDTALGKEIIHRDVDVVTGSVSASHLIRNYSASGAAAGPADITKAIDGKVFCRFTAPPIPTGKDFVRSLNNGVTWASRTDIAGESGLSQTLFPAQWRDDDADCCAISHAGGTGDIRLREYDDSANSWSSSDIVTGLSFVGSFRDRGASIRLSDGHLIVVGLDINTAFTDVKMRVFDVNGAASITELTNIVIDAEAGFFPAVFVDVNDDIYVTWVIGASGSRNDAVFVVSRNGGTTWSSQTSYPENPPTNIFYLGVPYAMPDGGLYAPVFVDISPVPQEAYLNLNNAVAVGGAATLNRGGAIVGGGILSRSRLG